MKKAFLASASILLACLVLVPSTGAKNYAVLISAGVTHEDDAFYHSEFWYDMFLTYKMLIETGYDHDDITVLYGEGSDFNSTHERYVNPYPEPITDHNNHKATIESVFASLAPELTGNDCLYVWWMGHGDNTGSHLIMSIQNTGEIVQDDEMAAYVGQIEDYRLRSFSFMTCYSGGIIDDLEGTDSIVLTSSDFYTTSASALLCDAPHAEFNYHESCAFHEETPFQMCGLVESDMNGDGKISFAEAFDYAEERTLESPAQISDVGGNAEDNFLANLGVRCMSFEIDDDATGSSQGNGNGMIEYGETIELTITLENLGEEDLFGVTGQLVSNDDYATVIVAAADFGDLPGNGGTASNATPFVFAVSPDVPDGHEIQFELLLSDPPDPLRFNLPAHAPDLAMVACDVDDTVGGDGDGIPEPGEDVELMITLRNDGSTGISDIWGTLSGDANLIIDPTSQAFGALEPGAAYAGGPFMVTVDPSCPELYTATLWLALDGAGGYARVESFLLNVGDLLVDDMEGANTWNHYAGGAGFTDQWHLETYRNHTYGGTTSWKCGGPGANDYGNLLHAVLESRAFTLPDDSHLTVWHWMDAEVSAMHAGYCYDGGLLEISIDEGPWEVITPLGGYPYLVREGGTPGPFPAETPAFSGTHDWRQEVFDLTGYAGSARIRFAFGSDGAVTAEGWYVDDVLLILPFSAISGEPVVQRLQLHPARPNPTMGIAVLKLDLRRASRVEVNVYDAAGRRVRMLSRGLLASGEHALVWDGLNETGRQMGAGVYWIRAVMGDRRETARLVRLR